MLRGSLRRSAPHEAQFKWAVHKGKSVWADEVGRRSRTGEWTSWRWLDPTIMDNAHPRAVVLALTDNRLLNKHSSLRSASKLTGCWVFSWRGTHLTEHDGGWDIQRTNTLNCFSKIVHGARWAGWVGHSESEHSQLFSSKLYGAGWVRVGGTLGKRTLSIAFHESLRMAFWKGFHHLLVNAIRLKLKRLNQLVHECSLKMRYKPRE